MSSRTVSSHVPARASRYARASGFGRVVDRTWQNQTAAPTVKDRYTCGYTRASNRLYRTNGVAANHAFE